MQSKVNTEDASNGDIGFITKIVNQDENVQIYANINDKDIVYKKMIWIF